MTDDGEPPPDPPLDPPAGPATAAPTVEAADVDVPVGAEAPPPIGFGGSPEGGGPPPFGGGPGAPPAGFAAEAPLVPHDASLSDAVGTPSHAARRRKLADERRGDNDELGAKPRGRRTMVIASLSVIGGLSIAALVFLGHANAQRYLLTCDSSRVTAEQGRAFPPWGSHEMLGTEWQPVALPMNAECKPRETDDVDELGTWYLGVLLDQASATLSAKNPLEVVVPVAAGKTPPPSPLDTAAAELDQALLLARSPERRDQRKEIERLLGDVEYWRASAHLREASAVLVDAAKQFDEAAAQRPRHVTDAAAWAGFLRHLAEELHAGPGGAATAPTGPVSATAAPTAPVPVGGALPVEPDTTGSAAPAPEANVQAGGVLL